MTQGVHLNLDGAWPADAIDAEMHDLGDWGLRLRYLARQVDLDAFHEQVRPLLRPFVLYGSGDFHHLTAVLLREMREPVTVVCFDNHPDWDVRPPRWACGGWTNRALELPNVLRASVWGCGNFECWWPHQIFGNRRAERAGFLAVHPWADDRPMKDRQRKGAILRD